MLWTVGHSTHGLEEFLALLRAHGVATVADVRRYPASRRHPHFAGAPLARALADAGLGYLPLPGLGGRRPARRDSPNRGWRSAGFRGYADYMQTEEFSAAIGQLLERGRTNNAAIMCAEAVPWRCHRSLIGDALVVRNVEVLDIMTEKSAKPHTLTSFARVEGERVWYPAG